MAPPASPEPSDLRRRGRQRLIGAIAIAVLLVVFVPMILDSEPRSGRSAPALEIPSKENAPALPPPAKVTPGAALPMAPSAGIPTAPGLSPNSPEATAVPDAARVPASRLDGFAVQVGAFKDEDKLNQARDKLAAAGIKSYIERRTTASGELTRLRAGPFATREDAEQALAALKAASLEGQVVALP